MIRSFIYKLALRCMNCERLRFELQTARSMRLDWAKERVLDELERRGIVERAPCPIAAALGVEVWS